MSFKDGTGTDGAVGVGENIVSLDVLGRGLLGEDVIPKISLIVEVGTRCAGGVFRARPFLALASSWF